MTLSDAAFGRLLRSRRESLGLSQRALAGRLGCPQSTVSRIEQGRREVTLSELMSAAGVFRCTAADLLGELQTRTDEAASTGYCAGLSAAMQSEPAALAQLERFGVSFFGERPPPAYVALPFEETMLCALRFSADPRVFETLPALLLKNAASCDWTRLVAGAYSLQLQNRLGMALTVALRLKGSAPGVDAKVWAALQAAHDSLAQVRLDREEVVGPAPKTAAGRAHLERRTPAWLRFWHGLSAVDMEAFKRCLPA